MKIVIYIVAGLILALIFMAFRTRRMIKNLSDVADHKNIITLNDKNFNALTKNKLILVDFWASWCVPCKMMAPVLNDVAQELSGNNHVGKINIEQFQSMAQRFNVRNIPTLILFKNGKEINRFVGVKSKEFLIKQFDQNF